MDGSRSNTSRMPPQSVETEQAVTWQTPFEERFRRSYRVRKAGSCWLWIRPLSRTGYGEIWINGKKELAHRASWIMHFGDIPENLWVLHRCDVPACVNPNHLFLGTPSDNSADMAAKGRQAFGEKNGVAKLTDSDVREIKNLLTSGEKQRDIAKRFSVTQGNIGHIARGRSWTHI